MGGGGWLTFGGNSEIESFQRAARLDRTLVLNTVADEVERTLVRGHGSLGLTQALVFGFAKGGIDESGSLPFAIWDEAFAVIAERVPRVAAIDDPDDAYIPPDSDGGDKLLGNIDVAFASMVLAGLAHPGREHKRRALVAVQLLLEHCPTSVAPAFSSALSSLSDPATCMVRPALATDEPNEGRGDQLQPCIRPLDGRRRSRAPMDLRTSRPHHWSGLEDPCCVQGFRDVGLTCLAIASTVSAQL